MARYETAATIPPEVLAELAAYTPLQCQLLYTRGITDAKSAAAFLAPSYEEHMHDPFLLCDMEKAVTRILAALATNERITIFSDYDCDGIPGAVVLHDFFTAIGHQNFTNYIPHRHYEGFGFSAEAVEKIAADGSTLVITIDCGTSSVNAVAAARAHGIDVIITDHHEPGETLPEAVAIVNPKLGGAYPFTELCGSGVVYKLIQALLQRRTFDLIPGYEKWWLDMVGLATIADMVPLTGENRVFAHFGLSVLKKSRRPGLQQLLRKQCLNPRHLTEDDVGFTIGPRINAASRMDTPEDAFFMLAATDEGEAGARLDHLEKLNQERKTLVATMTREANRRMEELVELPDVLVLGNPSWRPSLVGLTASKLAEEYGKPAFLWGRDGNGVIKGSARSGGGVSVVRLMEAISDQFLEHGGHHYSGGFSVVEDAIHTFPTKLNQAYQTLGAAAAIDEPTVLDLELTLDEITADFVAAQRTLAPYGVGNPKPLYAITAKVSAVERFGKGKEHTKVVLDGGGLVREAIAFFRLPEQFATPPVTSATVTLIAHVEESYFMNRLHTRLRLVDVM